MLTELCWEMQIRASEMENFWFATKTEIRIYVLLRVIGIGLSVVTYLWFWNNLSMPEKPFSISAMTPVAMWPCPGLWSRYDPMIHRQDMVWVWSRCASNQLVFRNDDTNVQKSVWSKLISASICTMQIDTICFLGFELGCVRCQYQTFHRV